MKTKPSELFDLIQSLNRQEKKRIRRELALNKKDKNLLMLYDIIDKSKIIDDDAIQKKLGYPKWFPQLKKHLQEIITDKVFSGKYGKHTHSYVLKLIIVADQFRAKGLYNQSKKKLELASAICRENGWFEYITIINIKLEYFMNDNFSHRKNSSFYAEAYNELNQFYIEKKYWFLCFCIEFPDNSVPVAKVVRDLRINEFLSDEKHLITIRQKLNYYFFLSSYYKIIEFNYPQSYFYNKKYFEVILEFNQKEENKDRDSDEKRYFRETSTMVGAHNVIMSAINANYLADLDEQFRFFIKLGKKFKIGKNHPANNHYIQMSQLSYFQIAIAKITRRGLEASNFNSHLHQFHLFEREVSNPISIVCYELIALYLFMKKNWKDCISTINKILNDNEVYKTFPETYASILLLTLFVNYEKGDLDILDYNLRKAERYFENHYSALGYEKMILLFFNEIVLNKDSNSLSIMKKYKNKLHHLLLNDRQFSLTYLTERAFIDFESWLDSKIRDRPFIDVIKEKAEKARKK